MSPAALDNLGGSTPARTSILAVACRYPGAPPNTSVAHFTAMLRCEANLQSPVPLQVPDTAGACFAALHYLRPILTP